MKKDSLPTSKFKSNDLLPFYDSMIELQSPSQPPDFSSYEFDIQIEGIRVGFADLKGVFNPLGVMSLAQGVLRKIFSPSSNDIQRLAKARNTSTEDAKSELHKLREIDTVLCVMRIVEIMPDLIHTRIKECILEVSGEALVEAVDQLKGQLSFSFSMDRQRTLRKVFELIQEIKRQNRDFPKRGGARRNREHLKTEQEIAAFRERVGVLRQPWETAIRVFKNESYDAECLNMLKGRKDLTMLDQNLLKEAFLRRKQLKEQGKRIPQKLEPLAFALRQVAREMGIMSTKKQEFSFETLRKHYLTKTAKQ